MEMSVEMMLEQGLSQQRRCEAAWEGGIAWEFVVLKV